MKNMKQPKKQRELRDLPLPPTMKSVHVDLVSLTNVTILYLHFRLLCL